MSDRDDLEIILGSHVALITVCTDEEMRIVDLIKLITPNLGMPLSRWTVTDGLDALIGDATFNRNELRLMDDSDIEAGAKSTTDPEYALRVVRDAKQAGIILLLDFHPFLSEPVITRLIKEIAQDHDVRQQKLVFISHDISLPREVERFSASFELKLPTPREIGRIINEEAAIWANRKVGERIRVDREAVNALVTNLAGLTDSDARRLVRNAIYDDGAITAEDIPELVAAKRSLVDQGAYGRCRWVRQSKALVGTPKNSVQQLEIWRRPPEGSNVARCSRGWQEFGRESHCRDLAGAVAAPRFWGVVQQVFRRNGAKFA
jgi:hypothetical protein